MGGVPRPELWRRASGGGGGTVPQRNGRACPLAFLPPNFAIDAGLLRTCLVCHGAACTSY